MSDRPAQAPRRERWAPTQAGRVGIALLVGVGATGISAGLGLIGTFLDIGQPVIDPSPLILTAPVVVVPGLAGAVLRGRAVTVAVMAGAVSAPIAAMLVLDGSCTTSGFAAIGLFVSGTLAMVIAGFATQLGDGFGRSGWLENHQRRVAWVLVVVGMTGVLGWIAAVPRLGGCP